MKKQLLRVVSMCLVTVMTITLQVSAAGFRELTQDMKKIEDVPCCGQFSEIKKAIQMEYIDYGQNDWYSDYMAKLMAIGGIGGYPDRSVRPGGTITRAEFAKILIAVIYGEQEKDGIHWSSGYVKKGEAVGIFGVNELNLLNLNAPITRQEMAKFISLALEKGLSESKATDLEDVKRVVTDKTAISQGYADYIYNAYGKGIITGYPDKTFGPLKTATRAEASTMLVRMLDVAERKVPGVVSWEVINQDGWALPVKSYDRSTGEGTIEYETRPHGNVYGGNYTILNITITAGEYAKVGLIEQWVATEMALLSKIDANTVSDIMAFIKPKTGQAVFIGEKDFYTSKHHIFVNDTGGHVFISVWNR